MRGKSKEEIHEVLKDCMDGYYGVMADEVKAIVVSFQDTPSGICPYVTVAGNAQTANEHNNVGKRIVRLCFEAAKRTGNASVLNHTPEGFTLRLIGTSKPILII